MVGATLAGAALRLLNLGGQSFDGDELSTAWYTHLGLSGLLSNIEALEKTPYTYYGLMWLWAHVFGHGEVALRLPSVIAGIVTIPVVAMAASALAGRRVGAATAALVAVSPFLVWYSQEARSYAVFTLLAALALLFFARTIAADGPSDGRPLRWWSLCCALALAVNYFAVFFIAAQAAWMLWRPGPARGAGRVRRVLVALVAPAIVGLLLLPLAIVQRRHGLPGDIAGVSLTTRTAQIPKAFLVAYATPAKVAVTAIAGTLAIIAAVPLLWANDARIRSAAAVVAFIALMTVAFPLLAALAGADLLSARYVIAALAPTLIAVACGAVQRVWSLAALVLLCGLSVSVVIAVATDPALQRPDYQTAVRALGPAHIPRALVMTPYLPLGSFNIYFHSGKPITNITRVREVDVLALAVEEKFSTSNVRPPRPPTPQPPPGFTLRSRTNADTYTLIRYTAPTDRPVNPFALSAMGLSTSGVRLWLQRPGG